jgi:ornithine cyclodeaminase/alanine dehydrogenase-like protein (mu-crystallin family)
MLMLTAQQLSSLNLPTKKVAENIRSLLLHRMNKRAVNLPKLSYSAPNGNLFQTMMAVSEDPAYAVTKSVGLSPHNMGRGLPHIGSTVTLFDGVTGLPLALLDGAWLTAIRTAALTLVAALQLASKDSSRIGFVGAGTQARSHLRAFQECFPIEKVVVYSRTEESRREFSNWANDQGVRSLTTEFPEELLESCQIVISSVPASKNLKPFLDPSRLSSNSFIGAVDCGRSWMFDRLDPKDWVVIDDYEQERGAHEPLIEKSKVNQDLSQLVSAGNGKQFAQYRRFFIFRGLALGDLGGAITAYEAAVEAGIGETLIMSS